MISFFRPHNFLNVLREEAYTITIIKGNRQWIVKFDPRWSRFIIFDQ